MEKKVISFSLYGKHPRYTVGAIANARHANRAYPGWVCRFYVADDVPEGIIVRLKDYGADVVRMGQYVGHEPSSWRFFATVDPEVDIALLRDVDSRFTKCELLMVNEWLASDKKFHVMRWSSYPLPILGGLWGVCGNIPNFKELLEDHLRSGVNTFRTDERLLRDNLYPQMKGKAFVHEHRSGEKRGYFTEETIHPFPPIAKVERGKYLNIDAMPIGMRMPVQKSFIVLSIYKRTLFSEYFLGQFLDSLEGRNRGLFPRLEIFIIKFYVADNIRPDLVERLRRFGQVVLKSAETVHKDDPQYWKLSILSEKKSKLNLVVIVDFWEFFQLVRVVRKRIDFCVLRPANADRHPIGIKSKFSRIAPLTICGSAIPITDIDALVAQRRSSQSYQEFISSTIDPLISTMKMKGVFVAPSRGFVENWIRILSPRWLKIVTGRVKRHRNSIASLTRR